MFRYRITSNGLTYRVERLKTVGLWFWKRSVWTPLCGFDSYGGPGAPLQFADYGRAERSLKAHMSLDKADASGFCPIGGIYDEEPDPDSPDDDCTERRCRNCEWWDLKRQPDTPDIRFCHSPKLSDDLCGEVVNDLACTDSYNDSILITGPDFGCVNYEPKEAKP